MDTNALASLERDWKAGLLAMRILRIKYSLTEDMIKTYASEHKWGPRAALREQIDQAATRALIDRVVSDAGLPTPSGGALVSEQGQMDQYGQLLAGVLQGHQHDIKRGRNMANSMMAELEALAPVHVDMEAIENMAIVVEAEGNRDLAALLRKDTLPKTMAQKVKHLQSRLHMLQTVAGIQATYIPLERKAWGMDALESENKDTYEELLAAAQKLNAQ